MKTKKKSNKVKPRIKVAPPQRRHKTKKDYNRKELEEFADKFLEENKDLMDDLRKIEEKEKEEAAFSKLPTNQFLD